MAFRFGLSNLPLEPPDDPSALLTEQPDDLDTLFSPNGFTSIGMQRAARAQVVPAQLRLPVRRMPPPGSYPGQGGGLAPGGGPVTEIPMPEWWKTWGPALGAIAQSLPSLMTGSGSGAERDTPECKEEWADARDFCAKELAKPFPDTYRTGGYTNVEDCAKGRVTERCGGSPKAAGYPSGDKKSKKGGDPPSGGNSKKGGYSPKKKPRRNGSVDVDPDDVPSIVPE